MKSQSLQLASDLYKAKKAISMSPTCPILRGFTAVLAHKSAECFWTSLSLCPPSTTSRRLATPRALCTDRQGEGGERSSLMLSLKQYEIANVYIHLGQTTKYVCVNNYNLA